MSHTHYLLVSLFTCLLFTQCAPTGPAKAPNPSAQAVNQLAIAGNACGPAATLNALRFGASEYQAAAKAIPGDSDRSQLRHIILKHGGTWSRHVPQRYRWSRRGINAADLTDVTNELIRASKAPVVKLAIPTGISAFEHSYDQLARSLRLGFPPIVGLRRYEGINAIDSHFITIVQVPDQLEKNAETYAIRYIDPMGGRTHDGTIRVKQGNLHAQLIADTPRTPVGLSKAKGPSVLLMDALIVAP